MQRSSSNLFDRITMLVLLLFPVLNIYAIGDKSANVVSIIILILIFLLFFSFQMKYRRIKMPKQLLYLFIYLYIITFITSVDQGISALLPLSFFLVFFSNYIYWKTFDELVFLKYYKSLVIVSVLLFFVQYLVQQFTGYGISGIIPGLPISTGVSENIVEHTLSGEARNRSFFSEPSHLAQFLLPYLIISLYSKNSISKFSKLVILSIIIVLLLLDSGTALIGLIPILFFIVLDLKHRYKHQRIYYILLLIVLMFFLLVFYFYTQSNTNLFERVSELEPETTIASSGFMRIWRGYFVLADYSLLEFIFGNPDTDHLIKHIYNTNMDFGMDNFSLTYFNGIQSLLMKQGVFGLFLFLWLISSLWRNNTLCGKCLLATMIVLMFIESLYLTSTMCVFLLLAYSSKKTNLNHI